MMFEGGNQALAKEGGEKSRTGGGGPEGQRKFLLI